MTNVQAEVGDLVVWRFVQKPKDGTNAVILGFRAWSSSGTSMHHLAIMIDQTTARPQFMLEKEGHPETGYGRASDEQISRYGQLWAVHKYPLQEWLREVAAYCRNKESRLKLSEYDRLLRLLGPFTDRRT